MTVRMNSSRLGTPQHGRLGAVIKKITKAALLRLNVQGVYFQIVLAASTLVFSFLTVLSAAACLVYGEIRTLHAIKLKSLDDFVREIDLIYGQVQSSTSGRCTPQNLERLQEVLLNQRAILHIGLGFSGQGVECSTMTGPLKYAVKTPADQYSLPLGGFISSLPVNALLSHAGANLRLPVLQRGGIYLFMDEARYSQLFGMDDFQMLGDFLQIATRIEGVHLGWLSKGGEGELQLKSSLRWAMPAVEINSRLHQSADEIQLTSTVDTQSLLMAGKGRYLALVLLLSGAWAALLFAAVRCLLKRLDSTEFYIRHLCTMEDVHCFYQPIVSVQDGRVVGCEVLTRISRRAGHVMPDEFIPVLMKCGLQKWYDEMVCRRALQEITRVPGLPAGFHVAINFFSHSIDAQWLDDLSQGLAHSIKLVIEVTEYQFSEAMLPDLLKLRHAGFLISIDDFGTGYSNLGMLGKISPNYLKIDKSFISSVNDATVAASLVPEIVGIAKAIDCELIAEGVETEAQLEKIRALGIAYAQGYLFARPLAWGVFHEYLCGRNVPQAAPSMEC
ncbi:EAL domain-containing protein [Curvibacter gracilis]|uniref:EAL domain-containing protein n=1 Tax=Curvibacter gracilis TaxID=230310 RepID=UPI0004AD9081|nr:EAL domain-containing protein [Curvibacter gracilis]